MTENNPYSSPTDGQTPPIDLKLLQAVAAHLAAARDNPPTVAGTLLKWPGTPVLLIVGAIGTAILVMLASGDSALTWHWPLGFSSMIFGAFLRDIGLARRVKRMWPPQSKFIDWNKVDEFTP